MARVKLSVVPELRVSRMSSGILGSLPTPVTSQTPFEQSISAPNLRQTSTAAMLSLPVEGLRMVDRPSARVARKTARMVFDLLPLIVAWPRNADGLTKALMAVSRMFPCPVVDRS